jgi:hypothetical protein
LSTLERLATGLGLSVRELIPEQTSTASEKKGA